MERRKSRCRTTLDTTLDTTKDTDLESVRYGAPPAGFWGGLAMGWTGDGVDWPRPADAPLPYLYIKPFISFLFLSLISL